MKKVIGGVVTAVVMVVAVILLVMSTVRVPAGYIAVQYSMSGESRVMFSHKDGM